jgi:hypothetical protein
MPYFQSAERPVEAKSQIRPPGVKRVQQVATLSPVAFVATLCLAFTVAALKTF